MSWLPGSSDLEPGSKLTAALLNLTRALAFRTVHWFSVEIRLAASNAAESDLFGVDEEDGIATACDRSSSTRGRGVLLAFWKPLEPRSVSSRCVLLAFCWRAGPVTI